MPWSIALPHVILTNPFLAVATPITAGTAIALLTNRKIDRGSRHPESRPRPLLTTCRQVNSLNLQGTPAAALQPPWLALRTGLDSPVRIDGVRIPPRHHDRVPIALARRA